MKVKEKNYWKWRHKIEEMQHAETKIHNSQIVFSLMEKDIEIQKLKAQIYRNVIKANEESHTAKKKEYEDIKLELEKELGRSLNGCSINDETLEVIQLDK